MKARLDTHNRITNWLGIIGIALMLFSPVMMFNQLYMFSGGIAGLLAVNTYMEFMPAFRGNIGHRLLAVMAILVTAILYVVYLFIMLAIFKH